MAKDRIVYLTTDPTESDNIGAFVRAGDDGDPISSTNVGGKEGLDVNVINTINAVLNASYAEDTPVVSGDFLVGAGVQRHDANTSTVSADGDYSLMHVNALGGLKTSLISAVGGNDLVINADGSLNVNADISVVNGSDKIEDSASANADVLTAIAIVRQDVLASSVSTDGDYGWPKMNSLGALWTVPVGTVDDDAVDNQFPVKIGARADSVLSAVSDGDRTNVISDLFRRVRVNDAPDISVLQSQDNVDNVAETLMGTALTGRKKLFVQNLSTSRDIYVGATGVTSVDGFQIRRGTTWEFEMGPNIALFAIGTSASAADIRQLELA